MEAGCGNAQYSYALHQLGYRNLSAVDLFDTIGLAGLIDYRQASAADIPWDNGSFDLVFAFSVIDFVPDPGAALREFRRLLRPGGILVISAHTQYSLFTLDRQCRRLLGRAPHLQGTRFRSAWEHNRRIRLAGLDVLETDGFGFIYSPIPVGIRVFKKIHRDVFRGKDLFAEHPAGRAVRSVIGYHSLHAACRTS